MKVESLFLSFSVLLILLCGCPRPVFAQAKELLLNGTITMQTGEQFPYKLVLKEAGGKASGYSVTFSEPEETRTTIKAIIDRQMQTVSFKETAIIASHSHRTKAYMCLIDAQLEVQQGSAGKVLAGLITSKEADKTACTPGTITFSDAREIERLFSYNDEPDTVIVMKKRVIAPVGTTTVTKAPTIPIIEKITTGIEKTFEWYSDTVVIDLWDGGDIDGDRITLRLNGKPLLERYYLVKEKKQLRIPVPGSGVYTLSIMADNEGDDPPNTASLLLTDGAIPYSVLAYNNKGNKAEIKIKKLPKR